MKRLPLNYFKCFKVLTTHIGHKSLNIIALQFAALLAGLAATSCDDQRFDSPTPELGDGEAEITAVASFKSYTPALDSRTPGTALNGIDNLFVIVYNADGSLHSTQQITGYTTETNTTAPPDGEGVDQPVSTSKATFKMRIPYGYYRIYTAANIRGSQATDILNPEKVATEQMLKAISFDWNSTDIEMNDQMFGYFQTGSDESAIPSGNEGNTFEAPQVAVGRPDVQLTAWLRRLASKVTVGYDPTGLYEGVTLYIKSVTVHDIARSCALGEINSPKEADRLITSGASISYVADGKDASNRDNWLRIQKGTPGGPVFGTGHTGSDPSLFFFENNQGNFADAPDKELYNKTMNKAEMDNNTFYPDHTKPGGDDRYVDWKDKVPMGTYVEVQAYYTSTNKERPSSGPIRYRFMLGKNTTYDYNAQRNHHFKLTLRFRGWANEPDWHIDYDEPTPSVYAPSIYYISYLYKQDMQCPVRVVTGNDDVQKYTLKAEIIENNWAPYDPTSPSGVPAQNIGAWNVRTGFSWNLDAYNTSPHYKKGNNFVGFLSMRKTTETILFENIEYNNDSGNTAANALRDYYNSKKRAYGDYKLTPGNGQPVSGDAGNGTYDVSANADKSVTVQVPMFTRAKQMVPSSDFSGNNPYDSYRRKAVVRFTLHDQSGRKVKFMNGDGKEVDHTDTQILQVRRVVNPKAIWRMASSTEDFHVQLMILPSADATQFTTFASEGAWRARILVDPKGLISLTRDGKTVTGQGNCVEGSTGSDIDFYYKPTGAIGPKETRCGIIEVEYHDYTCKHLIFVRQGYDAPVTLGGKQWSCYNVYATSVAGSNSQPSTPTQVNVVVTKSPLSIGSFYKRNNYAYAITESNNSTYGWLTPITDRNLNTAYLDASNEVKTRNTTWGSFGGFAWTQWTSSATRDDHKWADTWKPVNNSNISGNLAVPTYNNFESLHSSCEFGYGVVYADGASSVQTDITEAYGYTDPENKGLESHMGVRACVIYNPKNGDQILFPLGNVGQGRRAVSNYAWTSVNHFGSGNRDKNYVGALTYSGIRSVLAGNGNMNRPITYNLYRNAGAVYWFKQPVKGLESTNTSKQRAASWDISYFTFVFNRYDDGSLGEYDSEHPDALNAITSTDALPLKLIYK